MPETNSMAGRACVRHVVEIDKIPRVATTQKTPSLRAGVVRRGRKTKRDEARGQR